HGDAFAVGRQGELMNVAMVINDLLGSPGIEIELPDLRNLVRAVAVFEVRELLAEVLPFRLDEVLVNEVVERIAGRAERERLNSACDASDRRRFAVVGNAPHLWLAVPGRLLVAFAFAIGQNIDQIAVGRPRWRAIRSTVEGQATRRRHLHLALRALFP